MRRSRGYRVNTRKLLKLSPRERGKTTLNKLLHSYEEGEKVVVILNPSVHKGMPHRRFHGRVGIIASKRGRSYVVHVSQGDASKEIIVRPEHLVPYASNVGG